MSAPAPKKNFAPTKQQLEAAEPRQSIWVSANAGSGKTHVLVERVVRLLLGGAEPASILCITYTKAAAAEMANRLFKRLGGWTGLSDAELTQELVVMGETIRDKTHLARARRLFTEALETPGGLKIQTIHAFCERLLHLFPVEAGLAPGFTVLDDRGSKELQQRATDAVQNEIGQDPNGALAEAFDALTDRLNKDDFDSLIRSYLTALQKLGPQAASIDGLAYATILKQGLGLDIASTLETVSAELIAIDRAAFKHHAEILRPYGLYHGVDAGALLSEIAKAPDPLSALTEYFTVSDGKKPRSQSRLAKPKAIEANPDSGLFLVEQQVRFMRLASQRNTHEIIQGSTHAFLLAKAILTRVEQEKRRTGQYEFADLISRTAQLLSHARATQWVLSKLDSGLTHILLDEAQDTGGDQWRIVDALAQEFFAGEGRHDGRPRTLFVVGDQKQSIYSFQGADAQAYEGARQKHAQSGTLSEVELALSYRSTAPVLNAVNTIFDRDGLARAGIVASKESPHTPSRVNDEGVVEIWPLVEQTDFDKGDPWQKPIDRPPQNSPKRLLAREIAQRIKTWIDPAKPRKLAGKNEAVTAEDILILFRKRNDVFRLVLAELRSAKVPVAGADRLSMLGSLIVKDLLILIQWLLLPRDDHALAVVLKSPLVPKPIGEDELFALSFERKSPLLEKLAGENAAWLTDLQHRAKYSGPHALLAHVLNQHRRDIMARLGIEAIEASDALLDFALDYETQHGPSLFGFLRWFEATETQLKREMEKGTGAVRMMTVHGAKGLEAPIVILADATAPPAAGNTGPNVIQLPSDVTGAGLPLWLIGGFEPWVEELQRWKDNSNDLRRQENMRLLYVAITRAADELYIAGVMPARNSISEDSWWNIITSKLGAPGLDQPKRLGAADVWLAPKAGKSSDASAWPTWLDQSPPQEAPVKSTAVTSLRAGPKTYNAAAASQGRAVHSLLEQLADALPEEREALAATFAPRLGIEPATAKRLAETLSKPELAPFLGPESRGEVEIRGVLPHGGQVEGRLDRLNITGHGIWLLDYKTDHSPADHRPEYLQQMSTYWHLLREAYPGQKVTTALFWTATGLLDNLTESDLTAALQEVDKPKA